MRRASVSATGPTTRGLSLRVERHLWGGGQGRRREPRGRACPRPRFLGTGTHRDRLLAIELGDSLLELLVFEGYNITSAVGRVQKFGRKLMFFSTKGGIDRK